MPAVPGGDGDVTLGEQLEDGLLFRLGGGVEDAVGEVVEQHSGGVLGVGLRVADQTHRAALDPAGGVQTLDRGLRCGVDDAAAVVGDDRGVDVEGHALDGLGAVAHGAVHRLDIPGGELAGAADVAGAVELGALGLEAHDAAVLAEDLHRGLEEVQVELVLRALRLTDGVTLQGLAHQVHGLRLAAGGLGRGVVVDVLRVDDDLDVVRVVELLELQGGELGLRGAAAAEDVDLLDGGARQVLVDVVRDLGDLELVGGLREDARDVEGDVAHADDADLLGREIPVAGEVRVAVVETDELAGTEGPVELGAGDAQVTVAGGAGGEDDRVVVVAHLVDGEVPADLDVAQQADLRLVQHGVQRLHDALDARVIRCHAVADEAERGGHALEEVDRHVLPRLHEQIRGIDTGWTGTDNGDAQGTGHGDGTSFGVGTVSFHSTDLCCASHIPGGGTDGVWSGAPFPG